MQKKNVKKIRWSEINPKIYLEDCIVSEYFTKRGVNGEFYIETDEYGYEKIDFLRIQ